MTTHQHALFLKSQTTRIFRLTVIAAFFLIAATTFGQVSLPKVFSNHMVLQRNTHIPVWGKGKPGTQVTVMLADNKASAFAGKDGRWMIRLPQLKAGGPFRLEIFEDDNNNPVITFNDVLIGDVYLASGQSNMEWQVQQAMNADEEILNAQFPNIRLFKVEHNKTITPQEDIKGGQWQRCNSTSIRDFSAIGYYFARELHKELGIPIGILQSTWGGTPVEAWTSREMLLSSHISRTKVLSNDTITPQHFVKDSLDLIRFWEIVYNPQNQSDQIYPNPDFDDSQWTEIQMPQTLKDMDMPDYEGMIWLRKEVNIPKTMKGHNLTINLGHPELNYTLFFNGKEICKTIWNAEPEHIYSIPDSLIKAGSNNLAVRMAFLWGGGGFNPPAEEMYISDGEKKITLTGTWKYRKDLEPEIPFINNYHQYHSFLYNAMIAPVVPFGINGFIWYQGENNVDKAFDYRTLFPMLIHDWRIRWQQGYLPFMYVQLANYMKRDTVPVESNWALLRESQTETLKLPNTGMACIIDIGNANNIHPLNKQEVGRRLSLVAKKMIYDQKVQASGPMFKNFEVDNKHIRVSFSEVGSGLSIGDGKTLKGFAIAGKDQQFHWAKASLKGNEVIVSAEEVREPVAVRYGWANNPDCNLINKEGLPAAPFRTDDWDAVEKIE